MDHQEQELDVQLGPEGYLVEPGDWTERIAEVFAEDENIRLTEEHWDIIRFVRDWHEEHGVAPSPRDIGIYLKRKDLPQSHLHELFPYGYGQQVCRIAGMKKPRSWSTG